MLIIFRHILSFDSVDGIIDSHKDFHKLAQHIYDDTMYDRRFLRLSNV